MDIHYHYKNLIATITLARPEKRNALTSAMLHQLHDCLKQAARESDARLLVLQAEGSAFCAGMDLGEMQQRAEQSDAEQLWQADSQVYRDVLVALLESPVPTLAVVRGSAVAGGMGLVLACDLVAADQQARFALPEPRRGIVAGMVIPLLLYRAGVAAANHLLISTETIDAQQACQFQIVHVLAEVADFSRRLEEYQQAILSAAPAAIRGTREQLRRFSQAELIQQIDASVTVSAVARQSAEAREGLAAFLEKRPATWQH
jgi:methylglutaconyl-CoA hydratase